MFRVLLRLDSATGGCARFQMSVLKSPSARARICPAIVNDWKRKREAFLFFLLFSVFFFFLSFTVFPSIFISIYIRGIDRRRLCCRARRCFFIPFYVAIHSCVLRSCPRSDQTHKQTRRKQWKFIRAQCSIAMLHL